MKQRFYITMFLALLNGSLFAQKGERITGVFSTYTDFREGKLSYVIECNSKKDKIRLNEFLGRSYITLKFRNNILTIQKAALYGYQTCNKNIYIFYNNRKLLLLNRDEQIFIYKQLNTRVRKAARTNITDKYFSTEGDCNIQQLTT